MNETIAVIDKFSTVIDKLSIKLIVGDDSARVD